MMYTLTITMCTLPSHTISVTPIHKIKIHPCSRGQGLHHRRLVLTNCDYGFDELRGHGTFTSNRLTGNG
jgi:hypothetical protein